MGFSSQYKIAEIPRLSSSSQRENRKSSQYHLRLHHGFALSDGRISEFGQFPFTSILLNDYPDGESHRF